jgi:threonylcarbamoyladenosine tRNA methylthiotransferase MtaB
VRFLITTLGCKVNQYESAALGEALAQAGLSPAHRPDGPAELLVVNTCCVTVTAMAKSRQALARAVRSAPGAAVLVTGCYVDYDAQRLGHLLAQLGVPPQRAVLAGHRDDLSIRLAEVLALLASPSVGRASVRLHRQEQQPSLSEGGASNSLATASKPTASLSDLIKSRRPAIVKQKSPPATAYLPSLRSFPDRRRAMVKIQDGCDAFCSYCIVPHLRSRMWSRPAEAVERECRDLVAAGHREIILCGVFLGAYGRDTAAGRAAAGQTAELPGLIRRLAGIPGLWRLRLSSLECGDVSEEFIAACRRTPKIAPHFHLPLQSGSDRILRRMNRRYTVRQFLQTVSRLREAMDRPAITTDILVGFPGEDDGDFAATLVAAREAGFAKIHAFPFSPIEGTAAWAFRREAPPAAVVKARMAELAATEKELAAAYRRQFIGQTVEAVVEDRSRGGEHVARTDRYFTVTLREPDIQPGQVVRAAIEGLGDKHLPAKLAAVLAEPT